MINIQLFMFCACVNYILLIFVAKAIKTITECGPAKAELTDTL